SREAMPLQFEEGEYRLKISGDAIENPTELSIDDIRAYAPKTVGAVGQCTGLSSGLLRPLVPGVPFTKGDFSCATWSGARLKEVLEDCGVKDNAKFVHFRAGAK